jgi:methylmalonyl-CoA mutase C-terminal domain/subunit
VDEDVDAVGLSILSGSHLELVAETINSLTALDAGDIAVFLGGTIPQEDHAALLDMGVLRIFTSEMTLPSVIADLTEALK